MEDERAEMKELTMSAEDFEQLVKKKAKEPKKASKKKSSPPVVDPMAGAESPYTDVSVQVEVARAIHVYQRDQEPDTSVRMNAIREIRSSGPGTLVFEHHHRFGGECTDACKSRVFDE